MKLLSSAEEKNGFLAVGRIVGAHGIRGEVKVYPYVDPLPELETGSRILIRHGAGKEKTLTVGRHRPHKKTVLFVFEGVTTRNDAEGLVNGEMLMERSAMPDLEEGEYYWSDIIGLDVFCVNEMHSGETYLGFVESVIPTGSNDVYVIKNKENGRETLVPAIHSVITEINIEKSIMRVDLPDGL